MASGWSAGATGREVGPTSVEKGRATTAAAWIATSFAASSSALGAETMMAAGPWG